LKLFLFCIVGYYSIKCLGIYCGDCPLAIYITFAGRRECIVTSSQSIAQTDKISLQLKAWFTLPGSQPVHVSLISFTAIYISVIRCKSKPWVLTWDQLNLVCKLPISMVIYTFESCPLNWYSSLKSCILTSRLVSWNSWNQNIRLHKLHSKLSWSKHLTQ
jgi:hypothetical protein